MLPLMEQESYKSIKSDFLNITYVAPTQMAVFDKATFEKNHPDLYQKYIKIQNRKSYVIINSPI